MTASKRNACAAALIGVAFALSTSDLFGNPTVRWTFDEAGGGTGHALDTGTGTPANGVLGSTATRTTNTPGSASNYALDLSVAGAGSILNALNPLKVDTLSQATFTSWVKITGATINHVGGGTFMRLIAKQGPGTTAGFSFQLGPPTMGASSSNAFRPGLAIGGVSSFGSFASTTDILNQAGKWLFLAATYDGTLTSNNVNFYIGDETTAVTALGTPLSSALGAVKSTNTSNGGAANAPLAIGYTENNPTGDHGVNGYQDDVRIYPFVLDASSLNFIRLENLQSSGPQGDYNGDGKVNAADYVLWRKTPANHDNEGGYATWRANFGQLGSGSGAGGLGDSAVPEPSSIALMVCGVVALPIRYRRTATTR